MESKNVYDQHLGEGKIRYYKYIMNGKKYDHLDMIMTVKQGWPAIFIPHLDRNELVRLADTL
jgi:hypothetical protein